MSAASAGAAGSNAVGHRVRKWLVPLSLGIMALLLMFFTARNTRTVDTRPYEFDSTGPYGLQGLRDSLQRMGYRVTDLRGAEFTLPADGDLLMVWPGDELWTTAEIEQLRAWVAQGRTAVVVASAYDLQRVFREWGGAAYGGYPIGLANEVHQAQPLSPEGPVAYSSSGGSTSWDFAERIVQVTEVSDTEWRATLGVEQIGNGWLWYNTDTHALNNANLRLPDQVAVLAAILREVPDGGVIYFDAYHRDGPELSGDEERSQLRTLQEWLYYTPIGQATLLAILIGVVGWVMAGNRLGPPLKSERELKRREGAEYVRAIAGLKRRAHAHDEIARRQAQRLKMALARPRRIDASLDDVPFLAALRASGEMETAQVEEVAALLNRLRSAQNEEDLVKAASAVDHFLAK